MSCLLIKASSRTSLESRFLSSWRGCVPGRWVPPGRTLPPHRPRPARRSPLLLVRTFHKAPLEGCPPSGDSGLLSTVAPALISSCTLIGHSALLLFSCRCPCFSLRVCIV